MTRTTRMTRMARTSRMRTTRTRMRMRRKQVGGSDARSGCDATAERVYTVGHIMYYYVLGLSHF